jgi:hypothetical protein
LAFDAATKYAIGSAWKGYKSSEYCQTSRPAQIVSINLTLLFPNPITVVLFYSGNFLLLEHTPFTIPGTARHELEPE